MSFREDTTYTNIIDREYQFLSEQLLSVVREPLVWTRLLPKIFVGGYGTTEYKWFEQKDVGAVKRGMDAEGNDFDVGYLSPTTQKIPVFYKDIRVPKRLLEGSGTAGLPSVQTRAQIVIGSKLADSLEAAIGQGITTPIDVNGLADDVQDGGDGLDWGTASNIIIDTNKNYATLLADHMYGPYYTVHYATLASSLKQLVANTNTMYEDYVNRVATLGTNYTLYCCGVDGTAASGTNGTQTMIQPVTNGQQNFGLLVAQDWATENLSAGKWGLQLKLYGAMIHEVFRSNAGACVDGITDLAN